MITSNCKTTSKRGYHHLANEMIVGNLSAHLIGNWATNTLFGPLSHELSDRLLLLLNRLDLLFSVFAFTTVICITLTYEKPFRRCLKKISDGNSIGPTDMELAKRRLLNEPYMVMILDLCIWVLGSFLYWIAGSPGAPFIGLTCGLITMVLAFFWVEHVAQHRLIQLFFRKADLHLSWVPGKPALRIVSSL